MTQNATSATSLGDLERRAFDDLAFRTPCDAFRPHDDGIACCHPCFARWLRARQMEHWRGERYWEELDRGDFGLLHARVHPHGTLFADVIALIATGSENLTVITWAVETGRALDTVVAILTLLDINGHRLRRFSWLTPAPTCTPRR